MKKYIKGYFQNNRYDLGPIICHYMYVLEVKEKYIAKLNKHVGLNYILRFLKFNYLVLL